MVLYQGMALAVPQSCKEDSGFSPCYGKTRPQRHSGETAQFVAHFLCHNQDQHGTMPIAVRTECNASRRRFAVVCGGKNISAARFCDHAGSRASAHDGPRESQYLGEVWQHGFSETRADDEESFLRYREYIAQNPVKAGLADSPGQYPYCYNYLAKKKGNRG
jgi:hypothetical protein